MCGFKSQRRLSEGNAISSISLTRYACTSIKDIKYAIQIVFCITIKTKIVKMTDGGSSSLWPKIWKLRC